MLESLVTEAKALGEAMCITAVYIGIGVAVYHGCTGRFPWEEEKYISKEQKQYEPAVNIWEIPLQ